MQTALILLATIAVAALLIYPPLARARLWRATITPLASIIGSGFLVLGPILEVSYGALAPLAMLTLCGAAWLFGGAIRFNMTVIERRADLRGPWALRLETLSSWSLAFAYVISVAYYLNLFGAFGVSLTPVDDGVHARILTSAAFLLILTVGWLRGFSAMERLEQISVGIKLSIIAGLLVGLALFFADRAAQGALMLNPPTLGPWAGLTLAFGLIVTVQGFETSRYLGDSYDTTTRIRSMKLAQIIATAIYVTYIVLLAYAVPRLPGPVSETAIIEMTRMVAPILPALLVAAALSAQLSAAVADTSGSGGLLEELTNGRLSQRQGYALLVGIGLLLTWTADVFQIISYASRAFALYYALQAGIAAITARAAGDRSRAVIYAAAMVLAMLAVMLGQAVE